MYAVLRRLNHAGFIEFSARAEVEVEEEVEEEFRHPPRFARSSRSRHEREEPRDSTETIGRLESLDHATCENPLRRWAAESYATDPDVFVGGIERIEQQHAAGAIQSALGVLASKLGMELQPDLAPFEAWSDVNGAA